MIQLSTNDQSVVRNDNKLSSKPAMDKPVVCRIESGDALPRRATGGANKRSRNKVVQLTVSEQLSVRDDGKPEAARRIFGDDDHEGSERNEALCVELLGANISHELNAASSCCRRCSDNTDGTANAVGNWNCPSCRQCFRLFGKQEPEVHENSMNG